mmetsp:Transcript_6499/g.13874  ORF Transcript_6499/g.13874 Transcript_6499/m.13874 type:complete len:221 (+) Transcript_6499:874-1536(+)
MEHASASKFLAYTNAAFESGAPTIRTLPRFAMEKPKLAGPERSSPVCVNSPISLLGWLALYEYDVTKLFALLAGAPTSTWVSTQVAGRSVENRVSYVTRSDAPKSALPAPGLDIEVTSSIGPFTVIVTFSSSPVIGFMSSCSSSISCEYRLILPLPLVSPLTSHVNWIRSELVKFFPSVKPNAESILRTFNECTLSPFEFDGVGFSTAAPFPRYTALSPP